jgi:teichuronic acid biosynthesis glycosyltransferase TuaG
MDLISVIIPYYKKKKFINQTINSVLQQTYKNFELIIIYDDKNKSDLDFIKLITKKDNKRF